MRIFMNGAPGELPSQPAGVGEPIVERILSAAATEFVTGGIKSATFAGIAQLADVPETAVRRRWSTVEELLTAVVVRDLQSRLGGITTSLSAFDELDDQIAEGFASVLWFLDSHPLVGGALRSDADMILPNAAISLAPVVRLGVAVVGNSIAAVVSTGAGASVDTEVLTEVLTRLIQSLLLTRGTSDPWSCRDDAVRYARRSVVPFVFGLLR
jgi:AcrR family transcriptional regulator